jgi:hypothetical protein
MGTMHSDLALGLYTQFESWPSHLVLWEDLQSSSVCKQMPDGSLKYIKTTYFKFFYWFTIYENVSHSVIHNLYSSDIS